MNMTTCVNRVMPCYLTSGWLPPKPSVDGVPVLHQGIFPSTDDARRASGPEKLRGIWTKTGSQLHWKQSAGQRKNVLWLCIFGFESWNWTSFRLQYVANVTLLCGASSLPIDFVQNLDAWIQMHSFKGFDLADLICFKILDGLISFASRFWVGWFNLLQGLNGLISCASRFEWADFICTEDTGLRTKLLTPSPCLQPFVLTTTG